MATRLSEKICILDLETEETRFKSPEKSKLAFVGIKVYTLRNGRYSPCKYRFFLPDETGELEAFLKGFPGIIIGHNILQFDYRVLRPLISLEGVIEKTVDTLAFLHKKNRKKFGGLSLNNLSQVNLGKRKTLSGKSISKFWRQGKRKKVIKYNKNDCILTKAIWWQLVNKRTIYISYYNKYKRKQIDKSFCISARDILYLTCKKSLFTFSSWEQKIKRDGYILGKEERRFYIAYIDDMSGYIPFEKCPKCRSKALEKVDLLREGMGIDAMTEGQLAEYMAGTWGTVYCLRCGHSIDYEI